MKMVALLKGVNVGGNKKVPMPRLCALAEELGLSHVRSYINSGNIVFEAGRRKCANVEDQLENAIETALGFHVDVMVRSASQWTVLSEGSPYSEFNNCEPKQLHLGFAKRKCSADAEKLLRDKATQGEKVRARGDILWVAFPGGVGKSKLSPALFDRAVGSPVTLRNWNTVQALKDLLKEVP